MPEPTDGTGVLIDLDRLRLRFDDDQELLDEIFRVFLEEAPGRRAGITQARETGDMPRLTRLAHSLKGVAGTMLAEPLRQAAYDLEKAARAGDMARTAPLAGEVLDLLDRTAAALGQRS
ncbi:Hpt domain protein [Solidesulfovibrio carbinoliphilus subsp. oakridgensis]|uniref:Hpt domain protein n=1 Tax=Solidesulfovibrio carbinoliphilus subsp. oakridgensis TaxID=694327 RepID=G7QAN6_9BACT|nr:Hpt domain-containing protein [Solidesulfovibrio carbinoliphilus]EHJ49267.1 Hpt domain protein [Solidesulfovibrio carbinoliphilus subsp. oakridgensis]